jgi:glycine betaine/proline transport system ATP-binding protein
MPAVEFVDVDILFGGGKRSDVSNPTGTALEMLDGGKSRDEILAATGVVLGVAGANLTVEPGEICVLMGLSGSGKSTLLRAVNGLNPVKRGKVLVWHDNAAIDMASCDKTTMRTMRTQRIAMVFQQFALLPWRTVRENVGFGLELRGVKPAERRRIVDEKLKLVALDKWGDKYASELSGGMQQRVGLARAFATDADILLMDEPFSALDPLIRTKLQDELLALQKEFKKTIIFVSHDLDEAFKIGNQIAIMEGGRIVQAGTAEDIVRDPHNDYVREFVQHMNPLNVLRARATMAPAAGLQRAGDTVLIDGPRRIHLTLDAAEVPRAVSVDGEARPLHWHEGMAFDDGHRHGFAVAPSTMLMKSVIELRQATGNPVLLVEEDRFVGVCGFEEIVRSLSPHDLKSS